MTEKITDTINIQIEIFENELFSKEEEFVNVEKLEIIKNNLFQVIDILNESDGDTKSIIGEDKYSKVIYNYK